jgi:hypothetical protein
MRKRHSSGGKTARSRRSRSGGIAEEARDEADGADMNCNEELRL